MFRFWALMYACFAIACFCPVQADEFDSIGFPKFQNIEPRMVYGKIVHDFGFNANGPKSKKVSAQDFLKKAIDSKFNRKDGSCIVALDVYLGGQKLVRILTERGCNADWNLTGI